MTGDQATVRRRSGRASAAQETPTDEPNDRRRAGWMRSQLAAPSPRRLPADFHRED